MTNSQEKGTDWRTLLTLVVSGLGIAFFLIQVLSLGLYWLISFFDTTVAGMGQTLSVGLLMWSSILSALMLTPILLLSLYRMRGQSIPSWLDTSRPIFNKIIWRIILIWPAIVFIGWIIAGRPTAAAFLLGPINVLVAGIPVLWIYHAGQWKLEGGSKMRQWRIFGFSLTVVPIVVIVVELIAMLMMGGIAVLWMAYSVFIDPSLESELMNLVDQISTAGNDPETNLRMLEPYLLNFSVIFWGVVVFGGIVPIIEEVIKPLALWPLANRNITPQEGWVGGLLCGAGFALMENVLFFTSIMMSGDWLYMAIGRSGTGVLHMLASGLVGWGLAAAWAERKWFFLGLTTLGAFLLHGLWNALSLLTGIAPVIMMRSEPTLSETLLYNAPIVILLILAFIGIFLINRHLRRQGHHTSRRIGDGAEEEPSEAF